MSFLLTKLLPLFVYPLGLAIVLILLAALLASIGFRRVGLLTGSSALLLLWMSSTFVFSNYAMGTLESKFPYIEIEHQPAADAIVVLGGFTDETRAGTSGLDLGDGIDRLLHGLRLYQASRAPYIVLMGGAPLGYTPEAVQMSRLLVEWGVNPEDMLLEDQSRNTRENAVNAMPTLKAHGIQRVLLVTSAFHMQRAIGVFEKLGIEVIPAATDYQVAKSVPSILDWLPNVEALNMTTLTVKEYLGRWVYKLRGWI